MPENISQAPRERLLGKRDFPRIFVQRPSAAFRELSGREATPHLVADYHRREAERINRPIRLRRLAVRVAIAVLAALALIFTYAAISAGQAIQADEQLLQRGR